MISKPVQWAQEFKLHTFPKYEATENILHSYQHYFTSKQISKIQNELKDIVQKTI